MGCPEVTGHEMGCKNPVFSWEELLLDDRIAVALGKAVRPQALVDDLCIAFGALKKWLDFSVHRREYKFGKKQNDRD
jgi:hypothetical protein